MEELDGSARNTKMGMRSFFGALYRNKRPIRHFQSGEGSIRRIGEEACAGLFLRCGLECGVSQDSFSPLGIGDKRELGVRTYRIRPVQVRHMKAYLFIDGRFSRTVEPERDGRYLISFDGTAKASLVFFAATKADTATVRTPAEGERMEAAAVKAGGLTRAGVQGQDSLSGIYYGRYDYSSPTGSADLQVAVPVSNRCARIRVVIKRIVEYYGKGGGYTLSITGLRGSLNYDGTVTGDSVTYTPSAAFDAEGKLCTAPLKVLPNATGEHLTLTLYKDGKMLWQSGVDQNRKPVTLSAGDDVVMIADVERNDMGSKLSIKITILLFGMH